MAQVTLLRFATFYEEGVRGQRGGAPQQDKVWGVAKVGHTLVSFGGRRNKSLYIKTWLKADEEKLLARFEKKVGARTDGGDIYTPVDPQSYQVTQLCPTLHDDLVRHYYKGMAQQTLNTGHYARP